MNENRGVSHILGFILTFAVIVSSIALVSTVGYDQLEEMRNSEQLNNAERAFVLTQQNLGQIQSGQTVIRRQELDLNQGDIRVVPPGDARIRVQVTDMSGPTDDFDETIDVRGLKYRLSDTSLFYEGGMTVRSERDGMVLQEEPQLLCSDERAMVSLVALQNPRNRQLGNGLVTMTLKKNETDLRFPANRTGVNSTQGRSNVTVRVDSTNEGGWEQYFERDDNGWEQTGPSNQYSCDGGGNGVNDVSIVETKVNVTFTR